MAQAQVLPFVPIALFLLLFTAIWSIMRCAALPRYERLASVLERIPIVGRIFERFFRPDTYYREDSKQMYQKVFDAVINETIDAVATPRGIRQNETNRSPTVDRLFDT